MTEYGSNLILLHVGNQLSQHHLLSSFLYWKVLVPLSWTSLPQGHRMTRFWTLILSLSIHQLSFSTNNLINVLLFSSSQRWVEQAQRSEPYQNSVSCFGLHQNISQCSWEWPVNQPQTQAHLLSSAHHFPTMSPSAPPRTVLSVLLKSTAPP